ncbi:MAG: hypothetical protein WBF48_08255 [Halarcobacter sp.]
MSTLLKEINYEDIDFLYYASQQFATILFDRVEYDTKTFIPVIKDG